MSKLLLLFVCLLPALAIADANAPSVEENIIAMDTNRDGQITVTEIREYLEARHGKGYEKVLLDDMEAKAGTKSCASPFSKSLY
jgi:hypothetical protein